MARQGAPDGKFLVDRLRERAARPRTMAITLSSRRDAGIVLGEAERAEREADRIAAGLDGKLLGLGVPTPFHEYVRG